MEKIKSYLLAIGSFIITVLAALFMIERRRAIGAEEKALSGEIAAKDVHLKDQQDNLDKDIATKTQQLGSQQEPKEKDLSPTEVEKYWKDKK